MINYVEEMMRTAGVELKLNVEKSYKEKRNIKNIHPPFTAEKQLEIIKLIGDIHIQHHCIEYGIYAESDGHYDTDYQEYDADLVCEKRIYFNDKNPFEQALAQLTTELMNANELDKEKAKGILEGC